MTDRLHLALAALRAEFQSDADVREVARYLASRGFAPQEIDEALARFTTDAGGGGAAPPSSRLEARRQSLRVQGPHERGRFDPEAWGYLLSLQAAHTVPTHVLEELIMRALSYNDGVITLGEIQDCAAELGVDAIELSTDHTLLH